MSKATSISRRMWRRLLFALITSFAVVMPLFVSSRQLSTATTQLWGGLSFSSSATTSSSTSTTNGSANDNNAASFLLRSNSLAKGKQEEGDMPQEESLSTSKEPTDQKDKVSTTHTSPIETTESLPAHDDKMTSTTREKAKRSGSSNQDDEGATPTALAAATTTTSHEKESMVTLPTTTTAKVTNTNANNNTVKEKSPANASLQKDDPTTALLYGTDHIVLANKTYHYRYPKQLPIPKHSNQRERNHPRILVGVSSAAWNAKHRQAVRDSWGQDSAGLVFIVAGPWTPGLQDEFDQTGDLMWLDMPEEYYWGLTPKTMIFWHAASQHLQTQDGTSPQPLYDYFAKADDDVYFNVTAAGQILKKEKPHFWGKCNYESKPYRQEGHKWSVPKSIFPGKQFPPYATGSGVVYSPDAAACGVDQMAKVFAQQLMPMEDVASGMLMEACQRPCIHTSEYTSEEYDLHRIRDGKYKFVLVHGVSPEDMGKVHRHQPVDSLVNCGNLWGKPHYAYSCKKCKNTEWWDDDFCGGECEWESVAEKDQNGKTQETKECVPKKRPPKKQPKQRVRRKTI